MKFNFQLAILEVGLNEINYCKLKVNVQNKERSLPIPSFSTRTDTKLGQSTTTWLKWIFNHRLVHHGFRKSWHDQSNAFMHAVGEWTIRFHRYLASTCYKEFLVSQCHYYRKCKWRFGSREKWWQEMYKGVWTKYRNISMSAACIKYLCSLPYSPSANTLLP